MRKLFIVACVIILATTQAFAQPPSGRGGRGPGEGSPPGDRMGQRSSSFGEDKPILEHFPEIPDLTLQQREKIGTILTDERKDINKQMDKKKSAERKKDSEIDENELQKQQKEFDKIDKKIQDIKSKSDKKIKKILSDQQYLAFVEKREEFKFKRQHQRLPRRDDRSERDVPPSFPDDSMDFE